ncbi:MAG: hypothetical protein WD512_00600, partial [Candidatus Paceibacterota bacterium]
MNLPIDFFKVEKNELNGQWMVHSDCEQLPQCHAFDRKFEAIITKDALNKQANSDYQKLKEQNKAPKLT